jgi:hypothetical protein
MENNNKNLKIESFILLPEYIVKDLNKIDQTKFINIKKQEDLRNQNLDFEHLEGALSIQHRDKMIFGFKYWDLIDQLWFCLMTAIKELINNTKTEFYFPDQPTKVILEKKDNHLSIIINNDKTNFDFYEFIKTSIDASLEFYNALIKIFPEEKDFIHQDIKYIEEIKKLYEFN